VKRKIPTSATVCFPKKNFVLNVSSLQSWSLPMPCGPPHPSLRASELLIPPPPHRSRPTGYDRGYFHWH
jgi:hypothetical protein